MSGEVSFPKQNPSIKTGLPDSISKKAQRSRFNRMNTLKALGNRHGSN